MTRGLEVILITGCSGRIGRRLARHFSDPRYSVIGLDIVSPKIASTNFEFIFSDVTNDDSLQQAMNYISQNYGDKFASVIHLAPTGCDALLMASQQLQTEQFLFASSTFAHAPCPPGHKITESWPLAASRDIGLAKIAAEKYLIKACDKIPLVIMRIGLCYDEGCHLKPIARQVQRIWENQPLAWLFPGDPTHSTSYLHFDDLSEAIWLAVQRRFGLPQELTILVAEQETVSYIELQKVIGLLCHSSDSKTHRIPKWLARAGLWLQTQLPFVPQTNIESQMIDHIDQNYSCDASLAQEKLGWAPKRSLRQTLPKMIQSLKENPTTWYRENGLINYYYNQ